MAHVPLRPIGAPRERVSDEATFRRHRDAMHELETMLESRRAEVAAGWGAKYIDRVHAKGKRTARERIAQLLDPGETLREVGTFVNYGVEFSGGLRSPGAGVVTGFGRIAARWCMIIANDNTVASGSWWPRTPEKIQRAQTMALRLGVPVVYLVDCSGLFLPEQSKSFPGAVGAGHIFKMNSLLSARGVPQIAGVFGDCIAGGGYMPIISDRVYMTEQAYMVIAGAALIKGAKSQKLTSLAIGGPEVHVHQSGCADVRVPNDDVCLASIRREVERLPSSAAAFYRGDVGPVEPLFGARELDGIIPRDHRESYDAYEVLARICDQSLFWEVLPDTGEEMICGVGRVAGLYAGFVINRQGLVADVDHPGRPRPGGTLYRQGIAKISAFSRACNADGIPLVWLQDISGFDIGTEAERQGLLAYGSSLIYTNSTNDVPMFTVLLRKASGAGYYAMSGLPYDPVVQLSTPIARLSVMEGRTLAIATYNTKLDDDFQIVSQDPEERASIAQGMKEVEARIEADMDPYVAARQMDTDEIVRLGDLRVWLEALIEMSYQTAGTRRVKNPRIWSLHDLDELAVRSGGGNAASPASTMECKAEARDDGTMAVSSPAVGIWRDGPVPGTTVRSGERLGSLEVLGRLYELRLPAGGAGMVVDVPTASREGRADVPVGYGDVLVVLDPSASPRAEEAATGVTTAVGADGLVFRAPSAGRFYASPAPDAPPFIEVGTVVSVGQTVALLEIMKTFNRVTYGGAGLPERAKVVEVVADNGADLDSGDILFVLEPA